MIADRATSLARRGLATLSSLADAGLAQSGPRRRGPVTVRRMMGVGPGTLSGALSSVTSTAALFVLLCVACGVLWVVAHVGVWAMILLVWVGIAAVLYYFWDRLDFSRVRDAMRDRETGDDR